MKRRKGLLSCILGMVLALFGTVIFSQAAEGGRTVPHYDIRNAGGTWNGTNYRLPDGTLVTDAFFCDGIYTYYLQTDGTPMTDRLTYHPDGEHIIYFDTNGHEVFTNFQYCPSVGYTCYFDSNGYIYKDQITFMNNKPYYLDGDGRMQQSGWFQFANGMDYGYANWDGTLMNNGFSYDPWGRIVFYHWNGMVARGLITDGVTYYDMDMTDGHLIGTFPNTTGNTGEGENQPSQPEHTHSYEATITKQPTCTESGVRTYTCSCGDSYTESISATGHTWDSGKVTEKSTCISNGVNTYTCSKCGVTKTESLPRTEHSYTKEIVAPTCIDRGYTKYTCSVCNNTYCQDFVAYLGHNPEVVTIREATCTESGLEESICTRCQMHMGTNPIPKKGHNYVEKENTVSSETNCGHIKYQCSTCKDTKVDYYAKFVEAPNMLYNGDTYQLQLVSDFDEDISKYLKYTYQCRYYNEYDEQNILSISDTGLLTVQIDNFTNTDQDLYAYIKVELADNPYSASIKNCDSLFLEIAGQKINAAHEKIKNDIIPQIITDDMNDAEKVLAVHDWMCTNIVYDYDTYNGTENATQDSYYAYGAIFNGKAVCAGYARAYKIFMDILNIPCLYVSSSSMNHAWNQVLLDDEWYWLDTTWDAGTAPSYEYFLQNGDRADDIYDEKWNEVPKCTGKKWKYQLFEQYYVSTDEELTNMLYAQKNNDVLYLVFHESTEQYYLFSQGFKATYDSQHENKLIYNSNTCYDISDGTTTYSPYYIVRIENSDELRQFIETNYN